MRPTTKWITSALVVAGIIFALSPGPIRLINHPKAWEFREQFVYLTGVSTLSLMVLSMVISIRIPWVSQQLQGLDKAYVIHKWTGIFATLLLICHWSGENIPRWLVEIGLIPNPGELTDSTDFSELEIGLFQSGVVLIEWTFYVIIALVIVALSRKIPYSIFRKSHKAFPFIFLLAAYHSATAQLKEHWLTTPAGYMLLMLVVIGVVAAFIGLVQRIGATRKTSAIISHFVYHEPGILDLHLSISPKPFVHEPGQYVFLRFKHNPEPHPFTIASSGDNPYVLRFAIKSLGDFTSELPNRLEVGQTVEVEGPYGEFFRSATQVATPSKRQIWIAGGIGITPFMARLEHLANQGGTEQPIDLWYSTRGSQNSRFPDSLDHVCQQSGVTLYCLDSTKKEYLTAKLLHETVGSFQGVGIWFCGPAIFAQCLLQELSAYDFDQRGFHYDNFSMR